jgi:hypothetical protein
VQQVERVANLAQAHEGRVAEEAGTFEVSGGKANDDRCEEGSIKPPRTQMLGRLPILRREAGYATCARPGERALEFVAERAAACDTRASPGEFSQVRNNALIREHRACAIVVIEWRERDSEKVSGHEINRIWAR